MNSINTHENMKYIRSHYGVNISNDKVEFYKKIVSVKLLVIVSSAIQLHFV